ncbi:phosphoribosylamine--glycine ligase [soil metagenome]
MRVLLLGSGGRESALAWALSRSPTVSELVVAPGNPGIARLAITLHVDLADPAAVLATAAEVDADLVVVGPEAPLVAGIADALRDAGRRVFGPDAAAARIEGSKTHAKELMLRAGIPTAAGRSFTKVSDAVAYMDRLGPPYVIKADGLAAGKGVVVTSDRGEAIAALEQRLVLGEFGAAGRTVVIEEYLDGPEASLIAFVDGSSAVACAPAQDYKRALDGDLGPNTGGMGSYSPVPSCPSDVAERIVEEVIEPMVRATARAEPGAPFVGALYAGLALTSRGPRVIEFNVRFGDPETQALLPRLRSDLGEVCAACAVGELEGTKLEWATEACVAVVLASGGYPGAHATGLPIEGLDDATSVDGVEVFHAGTADRAGTIVTAGGRVLAVSALGNGFAEARARAYRAAGRIGFDGKQMRADIGLSAQRQEEGA